jgi:hypothetical protein
MRLFRDDAACRADLAADPGLIVTAPPPAAPSPDLNTCVGMGGVLMPNNPTAYCGVPHPVYVTPAYAPSPPPMPQTFSYHCQNAGYSNGCTVKPY